MLVSFVLVLMSLFAVVDVGVIVVGCDFDVSCFLMSLFVEVRSWGGRRREEEMRRRGRGKEEDRKGKAIKRVLSQRKTAYNPASVSQHTKLFALSLNSNLV